MRSCCSARHARRTGPSASARWSPPAPSRRCGRLPIWKGGGSNTLAVVLAQCDRHECVIEGCAAKGDLNDPGAAVEEAPAQAAGAEIKVDQHDPAPCLGERQSEAGGRHGAFISLDRASDHDGLARGFEVDQVQSDAKHSKRFSTCVAGLWKEVRGVRPDSRAGRRGHSAEEWEPEVLADLFN